MFKNSGIHLFVVEDDPLIVASLKMLLEGEIETHFFENIDQALAYDVSGEVHGLLLDLCHPGDQTGSDAISKISVFKTKYPLSYVCIQSGRDELELMRAAIKNGADRYILKDSLPIEVPMLLERVQKLQDMRLEVEKCLVGVSTSMKRLRKDVLLLRSDSVDVLIEGETGTGKEVCAKALHSKEPFVAVNCSAIPADLFESEFFGHEKGSFSGAHQAKAGFFEAAGEGTIFLDEVQSLSLAHQAKLLRVLEERSFMRVGSSKMIPLRARVISAANENLREKIRRGEFREDLYFRLAPLRIELVPLRSRREDVPVLLNLFLRVFDSSKTKKFSKEAEEYLRDQYEWPGNIRQLRSLVQALCLRCPIPIFDLDEVRSHLNLEESAWTESVFPKQGASLVGDGLAESGAAFHVDYSAGLDANILNLERHLILELSRRHGAQGAIDALKISKSRYYEKLKLIKETL